MWNAVELGELHIFLALAEELHFGRTAERLHIFQPGVSEAVRSLEARIGARLVERTSRRSASLSPGKSSAVTSSPPSAAAAGRGGTGRTRRQLRARAPSASSMPSPRKLNAMTVMTIAAPAG
ncbi:MAG TPA: LysR family transcriptional regulator [Candidatus Dormibacteraeota bacterium]